MIKEIQVTEEDIEMANYDGDNCPIAQALRRMNYSEVWVSEEIVTIQDDKIALPCSAKDFIERYDARDDVEPFSFEIKGI